MTIFEAINKKNTDIVLTILDVREIFKGRHKDISGWNIELSNGKYASFAKLMRPIFGDSGTIDFIYRFSINIHNEKFSTDFLYWKMTEEAMEYIHKLEDEEIEKQL